ncbi:MAG: SAM-dependent methyltransferase [Alphaproteobacteria bacterium GM7ARS4]|nr:SAM-dependent methyltransferase [Alphaproteobacteria bacterium GM7ARS4]
MGAPQGSMARASALSTDAHPHVLQSVCHAIDNAPSRAISVATYMELCLYGQAQSFYRGGGYHRDHAPLGEHGGVKGFTTSPSISQMFGELLALWCIDMAAQMSVTESPKRVVELGPGRGEMMADMQRIFVRHAFSRHLSYHCIECSSYYAEQQRRRATTDIPTFWHESLASVPDDGIWFILGNEFFDCFPIHQFSYHDGAWREIGVCAEQGTDHPPSLRFTLERQPSPLPDGLYRSLSAVIESPDDGMCLEYAPLLEVWAQDIIDAVRTHQGCALLLDYGHGGGAVGNSLRAFYDGRMCHPLCHSGVADLSASVDFSVFADRASRLGCGVMGLQTQGEFLRRLGIHERAKQLWRHSDRQPRQRLETGLALHRLTSPSQMGTLFKVLCLTSHKASVMPCGFASPQGKRQQA